MPASGLPRIFLLPGMDGTGRMFAGLDAALRKQFDTTVIRYEREIDFEDYVNYVEALLPPDNAILVAESFSGPVALALLAKFPLRFRCAILSATFCVSPFRTSAYLARLLPSAIFRPNPLQRTLVRTFLMNGVADTETTTLLLSVLQSIPPATLKSRVGVLAKIDMRPLLPQISTPVLYLRALRDRVVGADLSHQLVSALRTVTSLEFDGPHMLLQTRIQECAEAISQFILANSRPVPAKP